MPRIITPSRSQPSRSQPSQPQHLCRIALTLLPPQGPSEFDGKGRGDVIAMSFSPLERPGGAILVLVTADGCIDAHQMSDPFSRIGHTRALSLSKKVSLDWSRDGSSLCIGGGIVLPSKGRLHLEGDNGFIRLVTPEYPGNADVEWATWQSPYGYGCAGIDCEDGDPRGVCCALRADSQQALYVGDDFGRVSVFSYPCYQGANARRFVGHSASVTSIAAAPPGESFGGILSCGQDGCLVLWAALDVPREVGSTSTWLAPILQRLAPPNKVDTVAAALTGNEEKIGEIEEELIEAPLEYISQLVGPSIVAKRGAGEDWPAEVLSAYQKPREGPDSLPVSTPRVLFAFASCRPHQFNARGPRRLPSPFPACAASSVPAPFHSNDFFTSDHSPNVRATRGSAICRSKRTSLHPADPPHS